MIKSHTNKSLLFGLPGLILEVCGVAAHQPVLIILGFLFLLGGFAYYVKAKGQHLAWCLLIILGVFGALGLLVGLIVLASLKDKSNGPTISNSREIN